MPGINETILSFDRGIEEVWVRNEPIAGLPDAPRLVPWDGDVEQKVVKLLRAPSREEQLMRALRPAALPPSSLTPARFRALVQASAEGLRTRAAEHEVFARAAAVLENIRAAEDLLEAYRNALRQA